MRIFVAGAAGAIGKRLVPLLVSRGHQVVGTTRAGEKFETLCALGAQPELMDGLNRESVMQAVAKSRPEVIVHQMTALTSMRDFRNFEEGLATTNRLRTEGTEHLLAAARDVGVHIFVAQSYAGWPNNREGVRIKTEDDPLDASPPKSMAPTIAAIKKLESLVTGADWLTGIVLRYGMFYGPGTSLALDGATVQLIRERKLPLIGNGAGVWSFIHVDDAANATRIAIERPARGIYNIVDDDPAEVSVWLPELARDVHALPPRHIPAWLARFLVGAAGISIMTKVRGSSNARAKSTLNWQPAYSSWRQGFRNGLSSQVLPLAAEHLVSRKGEN